MGSYAENNLIKGENIIYRAHISAWPYALVNFIGICAVPVLGIGIIILIISRISRKSHEVVITNKRIISKSGWIMRKTIEMNLGKIESLQIRQGLSGRVLNYGSLILSGAGNPLERTPVISKPMEFRQIFLETQEELAHSPQHDISTKTYTAKVRLKGKSEGTTDVEVQGYTVHNAKAILESKYGKGSIMSGPTEI